MHTAEESTLKGNRSEMTQDLHIIVTQTWNLLLKKIEETVVSKKLLRSTEIRSEELGNSSTTHDIWFYRVLNCIVPF